VASPSVLSDLLTAFGRCWLLASAAGLVAGALTGGLLWFFWPQQYRAEVWLRLVVPGPRPTAAGDRDEAGDRFGRAQAALIQSSTVLLEVLRRPEVAELPSVRKQADPLTWLSQQVHVEEGFVGDLLPIRVDAPRADEAAVLARTIIDVYRRERANRQAAALRELKGARSEAEQTLLQKRQQLQRYENSRLAAAERELQQAQFDLRLARTELATWEQRRAGADRVTVSDEAVLVYLKEDEVGRQRWKELDLIEDQIRQLIRVSALKERDPHLPAFYAQRDQARQKLQARQNEIRPLVEKQLRIRAIEEYQAQLSRLRERVTYCEGIVASLDQEVRNLNGPAVTQERKTLSEEIATAAETVRKLNAAIVLAESGPGDGPLDDQPGETLTVRPIDPMRRPRAAGLGGAGSCVLLVLAVCWRESRLRRIMAGSDLTGGLGLSVVGSIPLERRAGPPAPAELDKLGRVSEAVDALRTVLLRDGNAGPRLILVTSAVGGEGKTALAVLLAASLARAWRKTLLLDADLRKPQAHALFGKPLEPGLSELLRGEAEPAEVVQPTGLSRLWLVPAGHWDAHAVQALAQDGAGRLFDALKEHYDFLVLDAGPVLPVADTLLLSTHVDSVLLTVRSGLSRLPIVRAAQQRLASLDAPLRGAVLLGPDDDLVGARSLHVR
jgi:capsular exopolysaccharide synthesis family protein